jgi:hypothetical protein
MPSIEEHCKDCIRILGKPYRQVHEWLDAFAAQYKGSKLHRKHRHHERGIREVEAMWGHEAAEAARIHIRRDNMDWMPNWFSRSRR